LQFYLSRHYNFDRCGARQQLEKLNTRRPDSDKESPKLGREATPFDGDRKNPAPAAAVVVVVAVGAVYYMTPMCF